MAIDYIINHTCAAKDELGGEGIIHLVKSKARGETLLQRFMQNGMSREEALASTFGLQVQRPEGGSEIKRMTVGQLMREAELLEDHQHRCLNCPAAFERSFGCFDSINYPISEQAEEWLGNMAAKAVAAGYPNAVLLKFILDQGITGNSFKELRGRTEYKYLQGEHAVEVEIEDDALGNAIIDTNQVMEMFFGVGEMGDVHQQFLLFFSGGLSIQATPPPQERIGIELQAVLLRDAEGRSQYWVYRMPDDLRDDLSTKQIKAFLRAVFAAQSVGATLTVDW